MFFRKVDTIGVMIRDADPLCGQNKTDYSLKVMLIVDSVAASSPNCDCATTIKAMNPNSYAIDNFWRLYKVDK